MNAPYPHAEFRIDDDEPRRSLRARILTADKWFNLRAEWTPSLDAGEMYWRGHQIAGSWLFARAGKDQLEDVIIALTSLFIAGNAIERLSKLDA